jgi:hypothetical protein
MATLGMVLTWAGSIGMLVFAIQILIQAFRTSVGWGLASLLIPLAIFVYVAKNWLATRTPFLRWLACLVIAGAGTAIGLFGAFASAG